MSVNVRAVQMRLMELGYDLGVAGVDNVLGPTTKRAVARFQADRALPVKWPGTIGPITLAALFEGAEGAAEAGALAPALNLAVPWYAEATRRLGLHESRDRTALMDWLKSDGETLGDPTKLPWCGDFVETAIALTLPNEPLPANPYLARNWLKFGVELGFPALGAIAVFWRPPQGSISGHVGFVRATRKSDGAIVVRGGNQDNAVTDALLADERLLGYRWPSTFELPTRRAREVETMQELSTDEA